MGSPMEVSGGPKLRIHFTRDDLMRIRLAAAPDPMWEIVNSLHLLQHREGLLMFGAWRRAAVRALDGDANGRRVWHDLTAVAPFATYFPDFLTPSPPCRDLETGIDSVLATPVARLGEEVRRLASGGRPAPWFEALSRGEPATMESLGDTLRTFHRAALEPYWPVIRAAVESDLAVRGQALRSGGEELLNSLHPAMEWKPPVLEMRYPVDRDLHLDGRGLRLLPSFFCWRLPVTLADHELPPVVVYPIERGLGWADAPGGSAVPRSALAPLLGPTRARILELMANRDAVTTTDVAHAVQVSLATVSKHTSVLREVGLIDSRADGRHVLHAATPLGRALLRRSR